MHTKTTYKLLFLFLLLSLLSFPFLTKPVTAIQTIYILANGTIQPAESPITRTGNIFTLNGNITSDSIDGIIIQRNNTILEGVGYTITGNMLTGSHGIVLDRTKNVTVKNIVVKSFKNGIYGNVTSNSCITEADLTKNDYGIYLQSSNNNTIDKNNITQSTWAGIWLQNSKYNYIRRNKMTNSTSSTLSGIRLEDFSDNNNITSNYLTNCTNYGIYLDNCASNRIFHNSFISAGWRPAFIGSDVYTLYWDDGYPSGGNYWSDYFGIDSFSGPYQNETGKDGIGDTSYVIVGGDRDKYPLMNPWTPQETTITVNGTNCPVTIVTNATITRIDSMPDNLNLTVSGQSPQGAYMRVIVSKNANSTKLKVFINGTEPTAPFPAITSNSTHYFIYFEFTLSTHEIVVLFGAGYSLHLDPGWSMVSFPVIPSNTSFPSIFKGVDYYQVLTWSGSSYVELKDGNVERGLGYWVLVLSPTILNITGVPVESYELDLPAGWSMIGSIYNSTVNGDTVFPPPTYYQLLTWNGFSYTNAKPTGIEPGKGYWALVLEPTHIVVDAL